MIPSLAFQNHCSIPLEQGSLSNDFILPTAIMAQLEVILHNIPAFLPQVLLHNLWKPLTKSPFPSFLSSLRGCLSHAGVRTKQTCITSQSKLTFYKPSHWQFTATGTQGCQHCGLCLVGVVLKIKKSLPTPPSSFEHRQVVEGASPAWLHPAG